MPVDAMSGPVSPFQFETSHSRESSGASTSSTPITPTFSNRSHGPWQNSNSSFGTTPESPVNLTKSPLHDLLEDPEERDDGLFGHPVERQDTESNDGPLCICDTPFCVHQTGQESRSSIVSPNPEWTPGDEFDISPQHPVKRRRSKERSSESLASRMSRRFPSISKRWKDQPTNSVVDSSVRSAPASRTSSLRMSSMKHAFGTHSESRTPPFSPVDFTQYEAKSSSTSRISSPPMDIQGSEMLDPISHRDLASTPLLPPMMESNLESRRSQVHSPLQSPTIAEGDGTFANTPRSTPNLRGIPTPPLSTKASIASFHRSATEQSVAGSDIPAMPLSDDNDPWAARLGHANFHISPEPYFPDRCNADSCKRLLEDWESARIDYMRQATPISEHYGPTSRTFKLAERKWAEIDAVWRANHELATAQAGGSARSPVYQALAETAPLSKMPSLNDPQQPSKFPKIDESDIVGPMVQYARVQRRPSRRPSFLKLFTDPASLLGRSAFSVRR